ncbi:MAG: multiheme c-type cytochrome [Bacteroidales bacterium]
MRKFTPILIAAFLLVLIGSIAFSPKPEGNLTNPGRNLTTQSGVCPPFLLYDEEGNEINPVKGINADKPYSTRQTCGKCHDYDKITQGFHFQQGKDETPDKTLTDRYQWVSHPGNYGGNWCSPAPLYRALAPKENQSAVEIDMTSFDFITASCGACHPGGGPLEFDRNGNRYDLFMADTANKMKPLGENGLDGDYFKANWSGSGVIEADCQLCHLPEYDYKERNKQLEKWNFKWAATHGSGLATVSGSVKDTIPVAVHYSLAKFDQEGKLSLHLVREIRNESCLNCHAKPGWKKRGTTYSERRDVHLRAGLKCVDCHAAGSMAASDLIRGKEVHQFGKGDDPSGNVRNDLDNTVRSCSDCHLTGYLDAPKAKHNWLPPLHLEKISCQACHIPVRPAKAALVQVSDVYNPGTKISPPGKYIWTFYDQSMNYWNHYGELDMFTQKDQPTDPFIPTLARYKGVIYPVNRVHSAWPGIHTEGKPGLNQPKMADIYQMWSMHRKDPKVYPALAQITDDNGDGIPEVNRAAEIDAFIQSVTTHLAFKKYDLDGKQVVWVNNDRIYFSGLDYRMMEKEAHEASPYASVHKFSHDIAPARAALGTNGCTDCHSLGSSFFFAQTLKYPFDDQGNPVTEPQYKLLGISAAMSYTGALRESLVKPLVYFALAAFIVLLIFRLVIGRVNSQYSLTKNQSRLITWLVILGILGAGIFTLFAKELAQYMFPSRIFLDSTHFLIGAGILLLGLWAYFDALRVKEGKRSRSRIMGVFILIALISGLFMLVELPILPVVNQVAYTLFDLGLLAILVWCICGLDFSKKDALPIIFENQQT